MSFVKQQFPSGKAPFIDTLVYSGVNVVDSELQRLKEKGDLAGQEALINSKETFERYRDNLTQTLSYDQFLEKIEDNLPEFERTEFPDARLAVANKLASLSVTVQPDKTGFYAQVNKFFEKIGQLFQGHGFRTQKEWGLELAARMRDMDIAINKKNLLKGLKKGIPWRDQKLENMKRVAEGLTDKQFKLLVDDMLGQREYLAGSENTPRTKDRLAFYNILNDERKALFKHVLLYGPHDSGSNPTPLFDWYQRTFNVIEGTVDPELYRDFVTEEMASAFGSDPGKYIKISEKINGPFGDLFFNALIKTLIAHHLQSGRKDSVDLLMLYSEIKKRAEILNFSPQSNPVEKEPVAPEVTPPIDVFKLLGIESNTLYRIDQNFLKEKIGKLSNEDFKRVAKAMIEPEEITDKLQPKNKLIFYKALTEEQKKVFDNVLLYESEGAPRKDWYRRAYDFFEGYIGKEYGVIISKEMISLFQSDPKTVIDIYSSRAPKTPEEETAESNRRERFFRMLLEKAIIDHLAAGNDKEIRKLFLYPQVEENVPLHGITNVLLIETHLIDLKKVLDNVQVDFPEIIDKKEDAVPGKLKDKMAYYLKIKREQPSDKIKIFNDLLLYNEGTKEVRPDWYERVYDFVEGSLSRKTCRKIISPDMISAFLADPAKIAEISKKQKNFPGLFLNDFIELAVKHCLDYWDEDGLSKLLSNIEIKGRLLSLMEDPDVSFEEGQRNRLNALLGNN